MSEFIVVARSGEIPTGDSLVVEAGDRQVAIFNVQGRLYAIDNVCLHLGGPLGEGLLNDRIVSCPWHGWTFDVTTGKCTFADAAVQTFDVKEEEGRVLLRIESPS